MHMSRVVHFAVIIACLACAAALRADITPRDGRGPLFRFYASVPAKGGANGVTFNNKQPLLVVSNLADLRVGRDDKSVLVTLTAADARRFADLTTKYRDGLLLVDANGRVLEVLSPQTSVRNGVIEFKYPDDAVVAEYVRNRFRIRERSSR